MAKKTTSTSKTTVDNIKVRMYRIGTGDCFLLQFMHNKSVKYNLMIDCGCILGGRKDFEEKINDLAEQTKGTIDLLIVTHEHADHINGFNKVSDIFDEKLNFKKVWFAWTEADEPYANKFRKEHTKIKMAINKATIKLNELKNKNAFEEMFKDDVKKDQIVAANNFFIDSLSSLNSLSYDSASLSLDNIKTMEDILRDNKVIKNGTKVEFLEQGQVLEKIEGLEGIRFFVLGPPKNNDAIKREEIKGEGYEKRESKSKVDMSFQYLMLKNEEATSDLELSPFDEHYILPENNEVKGVYLKQGEEWRKVDNDWLFSAGGLAIRHETNINNTSLAVAIQFTETEKILLFPGDAEQGSWLSWHDDNIKWSFKTNDNKTRVVNAKYIINNTVFYKVGHHLSQNGTPKAKGLEMFNSDELAAMVTLDFEKINSGWLNTMPNDLIGAELIRKTKGRIFFIGDRKKIIKNIKTSRTSISKEHSDNIEKLNQPFDNKFYIDYEVKANSLN